MNEGRGSGQSIKMELASESQQINKAGMPGQPSGFQQCKEEKTG